MCSKGFILVFLTYIALVTSNLAPFITKCKWDDSKCIKESSMKAIPRFADGIPDLNVETIDPLNVKYVDASSSNIKLIVTDVVVTGLKNCEPKKVQRDIAKSKLFFKVLCSPDLNGKYDMKGQLFVLPIEGNGNLIAKVPKLLINVELDLDEKEGKDGKKHWHVKAWKHTFELKDKSNVKFENLFPNNEFLRNSTSELIAQNGNGVINEIGQPVIKAVVAKVIENIKHFFTAVPTEDLALD
nr:circadian clock-controlled protein daywake [Helicoverpa armigera]